MMAGIRRSHQFFSDKGCTRPREKAPRHRPAESSWRPALRRTRDPSWTRLERRQMMTQVDAESGILPSAMNLAKTDPAPVHGENGFYDQGGGDPRERAATGDLIDHCGAQRPFCGSDQASENGFTSFCASSASTPTPRVVRSAAPSSGGSLPLPGCALPIAEERTTAATFRLAVEPGRDNHGVPLACSDNRVCHSECFAGRGRRAKNEPGE